MTFSFSYARALSFLFVNPVISWNITGVTGAGSTGNVTATSATWTQVTTTVTVPAAPAVITIRLTVTGFLGFGQAGLDNIILDAPQGKIIVDKVTDPTDDPTDPTSFSFLLTGPGPTNTSFSLTDAAAPFDSGAILGPGTYSVAETVPSGWSLTSATCSDGSPVNAISLQQSETVTCTFNDQQLGRIIVDKVTDPAGDPTSFSFALTGGPSSINIPFSLTDAAAPYDSGATLASGTYSVAETVPSGWSLTSATCSDGSTPSAISLQPGEIVTCTFNDGKIENVCRILSLKSDTPVALAGQTTPTSLLYGSGAFNATCVGAACQVVIKQEAGVFAQGVVYNDGQFNGDPLPLCTGTWEECFLAQSPPTPPFSTMSPTFDLSGLTLAPGTSAGTIAFGTALTYSYTGGKFQSHSGTYKVKPCAIPEPGTFVLMLLPLAGLRAIRRRRQTA